MYHTYEIWDLVKNDRLYILCFRNTMRVFHDPIYGDNNHDEKCCGKPLSEAYFVYISTQTGNGYYETSV